jgi:glycosyltransferase involved in cell wall biosynthesis
VSSAPPKFAPELVAWAKARGVKFVWNQNGVAYPAWHGPRSEELNAPMRGLREQADFIFYQSEFCRQCAERFLGPANAPGEIAFNCVDTARFTPGCPSDTERCRLLAAGSHYESYRVISVLETVAELVRRKFPVELHLAGRLAWDGAEAEVEEKIRELRLVESVRRTAAYRQEDAPALYQPAHILLHPKYKDPCPTVPIEAMACGVPVIGSASGGMPELVAGEAGVLLEVPESWEQNHWPAPVAMADAVETIMRRWPEYRAAARMHAVEHFSKELWLVKHRRVFHELTPA